MSHPFPSPHGQGPHLTERQLRRALERLHAHRERRAYRVALARIVRQYPSSQPGRSALDV